MKARSVVFEYPKFMALLITIVLAYVIFNARDFLPVHSLLISMGFVGTLLSGIGYTYGFTAAPATAILMILAKEQNIVLAGLVAGIGSLIGDILIFKFIRHSFDDEIKKLSQSGPVRKLHLHTPAIVKKYFLSVMALFVIASPLPDEIGVCMLAACTKIEMRTFSVISYALNTSGIMMFLILANII